MDVVANFRGFVAADRLNEYALGALLGPDITPQQQDEAEENAIAILQALALYPSREDVVLCEEELIQADGTIIMDTNGMPERCGQVCSVSEEPARSRLGFRFRCPGSFCVPGSRRIDRNRTHRPKKYNPLGKTILEKIRIPLRQFLRLLVSYSLHRKVVAAAKDAGIRKETAIDHYSIIREALAVCAWHDVGKIGGPGDVVEIDEVRLVKRKHNTGRIPVGHHWVFGGTSRATNLRFAMRVDLRNNATLHAEIIDNIAPGSIICSDGWASYQGVRRLVDAAGQPLYRDHLVVIHNTNFLEPPRSEPPFFRDDILPACMDHQFVGPLGPPDPATGRTMLPFRCHTQAVERQWRELRSFVVSSQDFAAVDRYIGGWMYKHNVQLRMAGTKAEKFMRMVADILRVYPGLNVTQIRANRPGARQYPANFNVQLCDCDECA